LSRRQGSRNWNDTVLPLCHNLTRHLRFALSVNYERLADEIAASPLAEDDYVVAYFSGFAWTF